MQIHNSSDVILIFSLLSLGFFGGLTHCMGMCGPIVLSQNSIQLQNLKINEFSTFKKLRAIALLPYHFGRITTYCFIGFLLSFLSNNLIKITEFKQFSAILLIFASLFFLQKAFEINFKKKFIFTNNLFNSNFIFSKIKKFLTPKTIDYLFKNPVGINGFFLGIILGFIPCGLLYGAFAIAATISNPIKSALAMFLFGIATVPSLFTISFGGFYLLKIIGKHFKIFARLVILINSATLFLLGLNLLIN